MKQVEKQTVQTRDEIIERLATKYSTYEGAKPFISAAFEVYNERDTKFIKRSIENAFTLNSIENCNSVTFKKLAAHWNNISFAKLQQGDYHSYHISMNNVMFYRVMANYLENNQGSKN